MGIAAGTSQGDARVAAACPCAGDRGMLTVDLDRGELRGPGFDTCHAGGQVPDSWELGSQGAGCPLPASCSPGQTALTSSDRRQAGCGKAPKRRHFPARTGWLLWDVPREAKSLASYRAAPQPVSGRGGSDRWVMSQLQESRATCQSKELVQEDSKLVQSSAA